MATQPCIWWLSPAVAPVAAPEPPKVVLRPEEEIKQLKALAAAMVDHNHFQVLGVTQSADSGAVKIAYFKLARSFHPDTIAPNSPPELGRLKSEIFGKVNEAYRLLSDDTARAQYIEDLKSGGVNKVDIAQIFGAEETFQKGCIMVKARKFPDAIKLLDEAIAANPEEGEFYAWRGFAKFFVNPDKKAGRQEAMEDICLCLIKNERCVAAHYFMGQLSKLTGDFKGASKHFQRVLQIQPDHIDSQRELRVLKK